MIKANCKSATVRLSVCLSVCLSLSDHLMGPPLTALQCRFFQSVPSAVDCVMHILCYRFLWPERGHQLSKCHPFLMPSGQHFEELSKKANSFYSPHVSSTFHSSPFRWHSKSKLSCILIATQIAIYNFIEQIIKIINVENKLQLFAIKFVSKKHSTIIKTINTWVNFVIQLYASAKLLLFLQTNSNIIIVNLF